MSMGGDTCHTARQTVDRPRQASATRKGRDVPVNLDPLPHPNISSANHRVRT